MASQITNTLDLIVGLVSLVAIAFIAFSLGYGFGDESSYTEGYEDGFSEAVTTVCDIRWEE